MSTSKLISAKAIAEEPPLYPRKIEEFPQHLCLAFKPRIKLVDNVALSLPLKASTNAKIFSEIQLVRNINTGEMAYVIIDLSILHAFFQNAKLHPVKTIWQHNGDEWFWRFVDDGTWHEQFTNITVRNILPEEWPDKSQILMGYFSKGEALLALEWINFF